MNWALTAAGFGVGIIVGLTGMGGGALMTPVLVIFFGIPPLGAVSSDLVASAVMKPVGSLVHIRHGRVNWSLVRWLCLGSVPAGLAGVLVTSRSRTPCRSRSGSRCSWPSPASSCARSSACAITLAAGPRVEGQYLGRHARRRAASPCRS